MADTLNNKKYLDLDGLQAFWNRVKGVILHSIIEVKEGIGIINEENGELTATDSNNKYINVHDVVGETTSDGGQKYIYYIDESGLVEELSAIDGTIAAEETARKGDVVNLAGENWDTSSHTWSSLPTYPTITNISEQLVTHDSQISALVQATEFVGVVEWNPANVTVTVSKDESTSGDFHEFKVIIDKDGDGENEQYAFRSGDIIIYGNKEYILNGDINNGCKNPGFVELGDVAEEFARLTAIENWINNSCIDTADLNKVFNNINTETDQNTN